MLLCKHCGDSYELTECRDDGTCSGACWYALQTEREFSMTQVQFQTALALAFAYGHHWANVPEVCALKGRVTAEQVQRIAGAALTEGAVGGICAPTVTVLDREDPASEPVLVVAHTTGSGRLMWSVGVTGSVYLAISRPSGDHGVVVIDADVASPRSGWSRGPDIDRKVAIRVLCAEPETHARHWGALQEALIPLVGAEVAWGHVLPWATERECRLSLTWYNGQCVWGLANAGTLPSDDYPSVRFPANVVTLAGAFAYLSSAVEQASGPGKL